MENRRKFKFEFGMYCSCCTLPSSGERRADNEWASQRALILFKEIINSHVMQ